MIRPGLLVGVVVAAMACTPFGGSQLEAHWRTPTDTADVRMPVTATWCVGPSRLDLRATAGDTGLGISIFPPDSSTLAGTYVVLEPSSQVEVRPAARVALRWMSKVLMQGWWGDSGSVTLEMGRMGGLSGAGSVRLLSGLGPDSLTTLSFHFRGVRVQNDTGCDAPAEPSAPPPDSAGPRPVPGVH